MKKTLLLALLLGLGWVSTGQAVVVYWAATTSSETYNSAQLVYVAGGTWSGSYETVDTASGGALMANGAGVYAQSSTDSDDRSGGAYYVALFNDGNLLAYSSTSLPDDDPNAISWDVMNPPSDVFNPSSWSPIPEPATSALFCVGAAVLAWRRRKRG